MSHRSLSASRGAGWITDGIAVFSGQPRAYVLACLALGLLASLPILGIFVGLFMPVFYAGLLSLLHRQARGETVAPANLFDGFQQPGAFVRVLPLVLVNLAFAFAVLVLVLVLLGPALFELARSAPNEPSPEQVLALMPKIGVMLLVLLPVGVVFGWLMLLALPRAMLGEVAGVQALRESMAAMMSNLGALLVNLLCLAAVMFVLILLAMIPLGLVGVVQQQSPALGFLLQIPVMTVVTGAILVLYCATQYQAWREIFAGGNSAPPPAPDTIAL
jgi:hypothetical protein